MDYLSKGALVFVCIMGISLLGCDGHQGMLSMFGISCTPTTVRDCTVQENSTVLLRRVLPLVNTVQPCTENNLNQTQLRSDFAEAQETREYRPLVSKYCDILSAMKECVNGGIRQSSNCFCDAELEVMMATPQTSDASHVFFCGDGGERLVKFLDDGAIEFWTETHRNETRQCGQAASTIFNSFFDRRSSSLGVAKYLSTRYIEAKSMRDCLVRVGEGKTDTTNYLKEFLDLHLGLMRCVNGTSLENLVPCKDLGISCTYPIAYC